MSLKYIRELLRFWFRFLFTWVDSAVSGKDGLCFFLCHTAMLHCFAPKPLTSQISPLHFALATIHTLRPHTCLHPYRMGSSSCSPACTRSPACTHPPVTSHHRVGRGSCRSPRLQAEPAAAQRTQRPPVALRYIAGKLLLANSCRWLRDAGPGSAAWIGQGGGLAFPTSFSGRAGPLQRVPLDALQRQAGATHGKLQPQRNRRLAAP